MKRRKDGGFTLIELMIVIAVIGILAVVLIPRIGSVKTSAKTAGLDTNIRMVQGYVQSQMEKWSENSSLTSSDVATDVYNAVGRVTTTNPEPITNPFGKTLTALESTDGTPNVAVAGEVYLTTVTSPLSVTITALDANKDVYKTIKVTP